MKLFYLTSFFLAFHHALADHAEICKGTSSATCDALGAFHRKIKNVNFCFGCHEYSEQKREITCDENVYTHSELLKSDVPNCVPPTGAPTGPPTMAPTDAPTTIPYMKQFTTACNATSRCGAPRWHPKQKKISTRGQPICTKAKRGKGCRISKQGKNLAKKLSKK